MIATRNMHVCTLVGARPQFVKAAALSPKLKEFGIKETLVHSGQHYDSTLSQVFFDELAIPAPQINLEVGSSSHAKQTGDIMVRFEQYINGTGPYDIVIVYGDTNTTLAGALVASKCNIPLAHIEAGMRSHNWNMPEEINRILTDRVSQWLFAPTETAVENLKREGLQDYIHLVGDVMFDATQLFSQHAKDHKPLKSITHYEPNKYYLATVHRASNTDNRENLQNIFDAFGQLSLPVSLPIHPRTESALTNIKVPKNVDIIDPVSYLEMLTLISNAKRILTDSGGLQKEAYWLGIPCVILREETEYPEICHNSWSICAGSNPKSIVDAITKDPNGPQTNFGHRPDESPVDMIVSALMTSSNG
ncbi:MAG: UDP-N-acetylglucosamine 2-epimerase (non-hydrolyzing) [Bacteroidetes bacterium]|nr:UDP-N-acetylglucosamine 2-epimerase (non-hydrolyzing) [Bacteroidota bacterium]